MYAIMLTVSTGGYSRNDESAELMERMVEKLCSFLLSLSLVRLGSVAMLVTIFFLITQKRKQGDYDNL